MHPLLERLVSGRDRIKSDLETLEYIDGVVGELEEELLGLEREHGDNLRLWDAANVRPPRLTPT